MGIGLTLFAALGIIVLGVIGWLVARRYEGKTRNVKREATNFYDKWAMGKEIPERVRAMHFKNNHKFRKELLETYDNGMFIKDPKTGKIVKGWPYIPSLELPMEGIRGEITIITDRSYLTDIFKLIEENDLPFSPNALLTLWQNKSNGNGHNGDHKTQEPALRSGQVIAVEQEHKAVSLRSKVTSERAIIALALIAGAWCVLDLILAGVKAFHTFYGGGA